MRSYQVEEHSIQQWLEARDRIGFKISFPRLLVLNSTSFCLRPAVLLPDPTVQQTKAQPTASKVAKSLYPLLAKLTGMYFYWSSSPKASSLPLPRPAPLLFLVPRYFTFSSSKSSPTSNRHATLSSSTFSIFLLQASPCPRTTSRPPPHQTARNTRPGRRTAASSHSSPPTQTQGHPHRIRLVHQPVETNMDHHLELQVPLSPGRSPRSNLVSPREYRGGQGPLPTFQGQGQGPLPTYQNLRGSGPTSLWAVRPQ